MGQRIFDKATFYVRKGNRRRLKQLIEKHAYLHRSDDALLVFTAIWDNPAILPWLLQNGVHPDSRLNPNGNTPLMQAACNDEHQTMHLLLDAGADPNARNEENEAPLGFACAWEKWDAAAILIQHGADVNAIENDNTTYLDWAIGSQHDLGVRLLQSHGAVRYTELTSNTGT